MREWLRRLSEKAFGPTRTDRRLTDGEVAFLCHLLRGDSLQLRALRGEVRSRRDGLIVVTGRNLLKIQFCPPYFTEYWIPSLEKVRAEWSVNSPVGLLSITLEFQGGLQFVSVVGDNLSDLQSVGDLLDTCDIEEIRHPFIVRGDDPVCGEWRRVFGEYLDRELVLDRESQAMGPQYRYVTPIRGADVVEVEKIGSELHGRVIHEFRDLTAASEAVNFFGIHLGVWHDESSPNEVVVSSLIINHPTFRRISILPVSNTQCAFFEGPYDRRPSLYATCLEELFARLYHDIVNRRLYGTQL